MAAVPSALATALQDRYRLDRELGQGGMATVYLAHDLKHQRQVAIKVLKPQLASVLGPERFLREIQTTASLHHPHILQLYDSGQAPGPSGASLFYVMPYVEGESLRARLDRQKQLPIDEALQIAREVGDALGFAHQRGIVHRDIKPENILLVAGHAMVADFGIAQAVSAAGSEKLTETGMAVGTPLYMSPEQAAGDQKIDGRSDLYSLGCVLYEMLAGQPPFGGPTAESIVRQHLVAAPPAVSTIRAAVPAAITNLLQRLLAKNPADRFQQANHFSDAISPRELAGSVGSGPGRGPPTWRRLAPIVVAALLAAAAVGLAVWMRATRRAPSRPMMVVLPFANLGTADDEYFADGITEEITSRLGQISGLGIISRTSALRYKRTDRSLRDIAGELGVQYVLEGSIRTEHLADGNGRVRVTPELIRVSDDTHLWTDRFDASLAPGEIFQVQAMIAERVAGALDVTLLAREREVIQRQPTTNRDAHNAYLLGRYFWNKRTAADIERAAQSFQTAVTQDSLYAAAYAGLADSYGLFPFFGILNQAEAFAHAQTAARKAVELDSTLGEAHTSLGFNLAYGAWDWDGAEREYLRAIQLDPGYATARYWHAELLILRGRYPDALAEVDRAIQLEPTMPVARQMRGIVLAIMHRFDEAQAQAQEALRLQPDYAAPHNVLVEIAASHGDLETVSRELALGPIGPTVAQAMGVFAHDPGRRKDLLRAITDWGKGNPALSVRQGWLYAVIGERDSCLAAFERGIQARISPGLIPLRFPSVTRAVGDDPRYAALFKGLGLEP